jgi:hypothetical protein
MTLVSVTLDLLTSYGSTVDIKSIAFSSFDDEDATEALGNATIGHIRVANKRKATNSLTDFIFHLPPS